MKIIVTRLFALLAVSLVTLTACSTNKTDSAAQNTPATTPEETTGTEARVQGEVVMASDAAPPEGLYVASVSSVETAQQGVAPNFMWQGTDGNQWSLESYRGKVVLLNFWATWCPPCRRELPDIVELRNELGTENFDVIGVSVGEEPPAGVTVAQHLENFAEKNSLDYPMLIGNREMMQAYGGITAVPTTFIVNGNGKITQTLVGMQTKAAFRKAVEAAM